MCLPFSTLLETVDRTVDNLHTPLAFLAVVPGQAGPLCWVMRAHNRTRVLDSVRGPLLLGSPGLFSKSLCGREDIEQCKDG